MADVAEDFLYVPRAFGGTLSIYIEEGETPTLQSVRVNGAGMIIGVQKGIFANVTVTIDEEGEVFNITPNATSF